MEREISIILKVKGAEAAKKAVESVFNNDIIGKATKFTVQAQKAGTATERVGRKAKVASTSMQSFTKTLGRSMAALYLYNRAWNVFGTQFQEGMELQRASDQFGMNVGNVSKMLPELRAATRGVVADFDLLKTASRAFQQGLKPEQMAGAFKMGTIAAQRLGLSATDAIQTITNAITKQDEGALNTLGIIFKVDQAYKTQAALIAKSGGVMSNAMGIQLRQSLILKELRNRFGGVNEVQNDGLAVLERFKASWKNFRAILGQTIGIALIPLAKALTGVLDTMTALLERMNKTDGFKRFIQLSATLAGIWAGAKFITGAKTLMNLFGMFGSKATSTGLVALGTNLGKVGFKAKALSFLIRSLASLGKLLTFVFTFPMKPIDGILKLVGYIANMRGSIMGLVTTGSKLLRFGAIFTIITQVLGPLWNLVKKIGTSFSVLFQLMNNYDERTGLSKVLKRDADELGSMYNLIENVAKISLEAGAALKGLGQGISEAFSPLANVVSWAVTKLGELGIQFSDVDKIAVRSSNRLEAITEKWRTFAKVILLVTSPLSRLLVIINSLENAREKYVKTNEGTFAQSTPRTSTTQSPEQSRVDTWRAETQTSTQQSSPSPRSNNLDYSTDPNEWLKNIDKKIGIQNDMLEKDAQTQVVKDSQNNARNNVITRR